MFGSMVEKYTKREQKRLVQIQEALAKAVSSEEKEAALDAFQAFEGKRMDRIANAIDRVLEKGPRTSAMEKLIRDSGVGPRPRPGSDLDEA